MSDSMKFSLWLIVCVACIFLAGFVTGYMHVIIRSQAYVVDHGDTIVMLVDGNAYHYEVSPEFYDRAVLH